MNDYSNLFSGIGVVVDDEVDVKTANISNILRQIEKRNFPYLKYKELPKKEIRTNYHDLSFVILDWTLHPIKLSPDGQPIIEIPMSLRNSYELENIEFIEDVLKINYCPIFIFTNADKSNIISKLVRKGLYSEVTPGNIMIKSKEELMGRTRLFNEINKWITNNPSIYVLKHWNMEYKKSKNELFLDYQKISPVWPKVLWKTYNKDGVDSSVALGELIERNLRSRMDPIKFCEEVLEKRGSILSYSEINRVLEGEKFITNNKISKNSIYPGDVFYKDSKYYVNIRAVCDLIPDRQDPLSSLDNVKIYLLEGSKLTVSQKKKHFNKVYELFNEIDSQVIVFPIDTGKTIDFRFKNLVIDIWGNYKASRIGRILPPYITKIQQKYASYLHRQGLPRIPKSAIIE